MSTTIPFVPTEAYDQKAWNRQIATILNRVTSETNSQTPAGIILPYGGAVEPTGWLLCDGRAVSRVDYALLFTAIGTAYGAGDGVNTFNLPDLADKTAMGAGTLVPRGATAGVDSITIAEANLPSHTHVVTDAGHTHIFTGDTHNHAVTDPGHIHTVTDPGHIHTDNIVKSDAGTEYVNAAGDKGTTAAATSSGATGVSVDNATTGVSVDNATSTGTNSTAATGISLGNTGSGDSLSVLNPVVGVNWLIKA